LLREQKELLNDALLCQPPLPGVTEYLASARATGVKVAVASSSGFSWVAGNLKRLQLWDFFDVVCTQEDVESVKPEPDLFLLALERLSIQADQAVVIEDSPNGILAARRAGIFVIAVPTSISSQLDLSQANLIIPSLSALPLEKLMQEYF
jgi:HAD superfamily hydrolase (TIGR01509 family)